MLVCIAEVYLTGKIKHIGPSARFLCVRTCGKSFSGPQVLVAVVQALPTVSALPTSSQQKVIDTEATSTLMQ